jgi:hypothetical protein
MKAKLANASASGLGRELVALPLVPEGGAEFVTPPAKIPNKTLVITIEIESIRIDSSSKTQPEY